MQLAHESVNWPEAFIWVGVTWGVVAIIYFILKGADLDQFEREEETGS